MCDFTVTEVEYWFRLEDGRYAAMRGSAYVHTHRFRVLRHTPKGVWLEGWVGPRFVLREARKRWACPTEEEARDSFVARKKRQARILRAQLAHVNEALALVVPVPTR